MKDKRKYSVYPSDLLFPDAFTNFANYITQCKYTEDSNACDKIDYSIDVDDDRCISTTNYTEFIHALKQYPNSLPIYLHSHWEMTGTNKFALSIYILQRSIEVTVESDDLNLIAALHEKAKELFKAFNPTRIKSSVLSKYNLKKSVFLAHRFDSYGYKVANTITSLLSRLGLSCIEGEGYETRDIPDKVADRIRMQDIFLCVVTPGDSSWLLSETAFAKALNKYIIILVQDGVVFNKGIIGGDYEHIAFPNDNIEKAFINLIGALPL